MSVFPGKRGAGHPRSRVLSLPAVFGRKSRRNDAQRAETAPDAFRCICDPNDIFDPPDPTPRAVQGCPAHRGRYLAQNWVP